MNTEQALAYLSGLKRFGIKLGNERMEALLERLGNPHHRFRSVHVAGTNGKGSTCTFIASILTASGYRTGLYLSPYVFQLGERAQIDGVPLTLERLADLLTYMKPICDDLSRTALGPVTEFEVKTAASFLLFAQEKVDLAVVEVGMGGRLDATNVITPEASVVVSVGLDHMERLGNTAEAIAGEKAGIAKHGVPLYTGVTEPGPLAVIRTVAAGAGAPVEVIAEAGTPCGADVTWTRERHDDTLQFVTIIQHGTVMGRYALSLSGRHQCGNAALAWRVARGLREQGFDRITEASVTRGLASASLPGRLQLVRRHPDLLLDGAHNAPAAERLADALREGYPRRRTLGVIGMTRGHDPEPLLQVLLPLFDVIYVTRPSDPRGCPVEELHQAIRTLGRDAVVCESVSQAVQRACCEAHPEDLVCVTGSFYVVGEAPTH